MRGFSHDEFRQRLDKAQFLMREQGMNLMLLTSEPEIRYFSGFDSALWQSPTRPWFLLIPVYGEPVAVIPSIGEGVMRRTWLSHIRTWPSPQPDDEGISLLKKTIQEMVGSKAIIGLSKGHESTIRMPLQDLETLMAQLPGIHWVSCTPLLRTLRMIKSEQEIKKLRQVSHIASHTFTQATDLFHIEQPLNAAFRSFKIALLQQGADDVPYLVGGAGQGGYSDVISPPSEQAIESGDILMLGTGASLDGYYCNIARNYAFTHASDQAQHAYHTLYQAIEMVLASLRPGVSCAQLYQTMQTAIESAGGSTEGLKRRMGHGLGMQLTEWPSCIPSDRTILRPNMVLTLMPNMLLSKGKLMIHAETILIHEEGVELLSLRAPPELPIIE